MDAYALARRIRAFRKLKGYTQSELADSLGVSIGVLGAIERGTRKPDVQMLKRVSDVLGIDYEELTDTTNGEKG
ncbi:XRE family transcriptional regulator [Xylanibacillus composti]|uniref:Putative HTH-type transcriptional regulator YazB n=1 Tax=Xylanibacillus composti TaxID=1572762 RepID=A0A8J4GY41_9BACL|nr:helix-turn-helix transcriptional regulator [Xylanibacillus composti]MDT9725105.1 XRE family transcriptional regulator [Xylanibacillus composti]GIQ67322.1 putative HTH-type transcriptional regulator YazB [Xylanibacillus composti]